MGGVNFLIGTSIKSKQFTRSAATCVRICGEINKLLFLDQWSLNALLIWEKIKGALEIVSVCACMLTPEKMKGKVGMSRNYRTTIKHFFSTES